MSGWHHAGAFKEKACDVCGTPFQPKSGVHKFCSDECRGKWKYVSGKISTESQYLEISGNWNRYLARLLYAGGAKRSGLSVEDLLEILEKQGGKCAISGVDLTCQLTKGTRSTTNASVDRIEAGGPYIKENVQLVCIAVNKWRGDTDLKEFLWWCKKITEHQSGN